MNVNSQYYTSSDMDSSYENFGLDPDWLLMCGTTSFTNQADKLKDILAWEEELNQSQGSNDQMDIKRQSQTNTGTSEVRSVVNEKYNIDQNQNTEGVLPAVSLPGCGSPFLTETYHGSTAAVKLSCSFPKTLMDIQLQMLKSTQKAETESSVNNKGKIDFAPITKGASVLMSVPTSDISFGLETYQVGILPCSSRVDTNIDESRSAKVNTAYQMTKNRCKQDATKDAKNAANCFKTQKERNKEAARAYRKRRRNKEQELKIKFGLLKKKKAVLEEELKSLKELYSKKCGHKKIAQEGVC
ncbi:hypothetical protein QYM36_000967 [Artemia franciscana]|uniref:BZIP domain-containing protein n=1 Tax=Artemia franciscana TaxID=6661 RepID=A0AA88IA54_ARTSF|nr:hypothetical protein QYM36_000967 [Artemia franciscana]